jgi:uncharacterized protein (DUF1810 family)
MGIIVQIYLNETTGRLPGLGTLYIIVDCSIRSLEELEQTLQVGVIGEQACHCLERLHAH